MLMPLNQAVHERIMLYVLAGVGTAANYFQAFRKELLRCFEASTGLKPTGGLLLPYGDNSRRLASQAMEVWHDIRLPMSSVAQSMGGEHVLRRILQEWDGGRVILIGHSGGGLAALHGARLLQEHEPSMKCVVVQIGSPKSPVPPNLKASSAYYYACRPDGKGKDPICRLGNWKEKEAYKGLRLWTNSKEDQYGPSEVFPLPIIGGHPDYFRVHVRNSEGRSNQDITLEAVWRFIKARSGEAI